MNPTRVSFICACVLAITLLWAAAALADGPREKIIYTFQNPPDAGGPHSALITDEDGNLYGATIFGGSGTCPNLFGTITCGAVYRLSRPHDDDGQWTESVLYSFQGPPNDGYSPSGPMVMDKKGNLYGVTGLGGNGVGGQRIFCADGCGTVFQLSPPASQGDPWTKTTLYNFQGTGDGANPNGALAIDEFGNLYGVTYFDGIGKVLGNGVAFRLSPPKEAVGNWTETILYRFGHNSYDAAIPVGGLTFDENGNLYGVSGAGGGASCQNWPSPGCGTIFRLSPPSSNTTRWQASVLYRFQGGTDGSDPNGMLTVDHRGNLYGVDFGTAFGSVFQLSPPASGHPWTFTTLYTFGGGKDGSAPEGGVAFDEAGRLYGTTFLGGGSTACAGGCGTVYELSRRGGSWREKVLHRFGDNSNDGILPASNLLLLHDGRLYGNTTSSGNGAGSGIVFEFARGED